MLTFALMILVTGGTGLVGAHLLLFLTEKKECIRAIYRTGNGIAKTKNLFQQNNKLPLFENIQWFRADCIDLPRLTNAFQDITTVYHCAGLISFDPKDEEKLRKNNIEATANVVNLSLDFGIKKLCFISSIAAIGDLNNNETILSEKSDWNPEKYHTDYAISKYGAEMEVFRGQQEGLQTVIMNPGIILGKGFWEQGSGLIFNSIQNGMPFYTKGITGFVVVQDVVLAAYNAMKSDISNERFILVGQNLSYQIVFTAIAKTLGKTPPQYHATPFLMLVFYYIDAFFALIFRRKQSLYKSTAKESHKKDFYSNEKAKSLLRIDFQDIELYLKNLQSN
jgi:nucleoside-diphosphate-sugar epimerase